MPRSDQLSASSGMSVSLFVGGRRNVIHEGSSPRDILGNLSVLCLQLNGQQYIIQIPRSVQGSNDAAGKAYTKHQSKGLSFDDTAIKSRFVENGAFNMTSLSSNRSSSLTAIYFQISKFSAISRRPFPKAISCLRNGYSASSPGCFMVSFLP